MSRPVVIVASLFCGLQFGCGEPTPAEPGVSESEGSPDSETSEETSEETTGDGEGEGLRYPQFGPVPPLPEWSDNPLTADKRALGLALFSDARLSSSGTVTCGTCHSPVASFQSNTPRDLPARSIPGIEPPLPRNSPSLLNLVHAEVLHWDGSESDLYESMVRPFAEPNMNLTDLPRGDVWTLDIPGAQRQLKAKLTEEIPGYIERFESAFGEDIRELSAEAVWTLAGKALAVYIHPAESRDSAFDAYNAGDDEALSSQAIAGLELFAGDAGCSRCHHGPLFSDFGFHALGVGEVDEHGRLVDPGRAHVTEKSADYGRFLTPSLRSVTQSSPFFHDGSEASIREVIRQHFAGEAAEGVELSPLLSGLEAPEGDDMEALVAFLKSLEGAPLDAKLIDLNPDLP